MTKSEVIISVPGARLLGNLETPVDARGLVIFAHGSGSSRKSPRNRSVAHALQEGGMATLLFDLLTPEEEGEEARTGHLRFNIPLLSARLVGATQWAASTATAGQLSVGYFGSSTGAAAALAAAGELGERIRAVVSRGGRPDLAAEALEKVVSPTLLIVGANDKPVIRLNEEAHSRLRCERALRIVAGATHLFEEPGTLETVTGMAVDWFSSHLRRMGRSS
jgi:pimeloyl-ACP methyl ester carboxylesterase